MQFLRASKITRAALALAMMVLIGGAISLAGCLYDSNEIYESFQVTTPMRNHRLSNSLTRRFEFNRTQQWPLAASSALAYNQGQNPAGRHAYEDHGRLQPLREQCALHGGCSRYF